MSGGLVPDPSVNLVLCRWAKVVAGAGEVYIQGAGVSTAPPAGTPWYLAGVMDVQSTGSEIVGSLSLSEYRTDRLVDDIGGELRLSHGGPGLLHVPLALRLPELDGVPPGLYAWRIELGGLSHVTGFVIPDRSAPDSAGEPREGEID